jgi:hypothetical protein
LNPGTLIPDREQVYNLFILLVCLLSDILVEGEREREREREKERKRERERECCPAYGYS